MGALQHHQPTHLQWHITIGGPGSIELLCAAPHVDNIHVRMGAETGRYDTDPSEIKMTDRATKETGKEFHESSLIDHLMDKRIFACHIRCESHTGRRGSFGLVQRRGQVNVALFGQSIQHRQVRHLHLTTV